MSRFPDGILPALSCDYPSWPEQRIQLAFAAMPGTMARVAKQLQFPDFLVLRGSNKPLPQRQKITQNAALAQDVGGNAMRRTISGDKKNWQAEFAVNLLGIKCGEGWDGFV